LLSGQVKRYHFTPNSSINDIATHPRPDENIAQTWYLASRLLLHKPGQISGPLTYLLALKKCAGDVRGEDVVDHLRIQTYMLNWERSGFDPLYRIHDLSTCVNFKTSKLDEDVKNSCRRAIETEIPCSQPTVSLRLPLQRLQEIQISIHLDLD
jgi:hypothetical protein